MQKQVKESEAAWRKSQKALSDALDQTDFFLNDDDVAVDASAQESGILASPPISQRGQPVVKKAGHHHTLASPRPPRGSLGSVSTATGMGVTNADQSSVWTEDGLSVSVESCNDDVDMT